MKKDISEDEWELIEAVRAFRAAKAQSPYYLEKHVEDCIDKLLDRCS